jgi:hypothetical protein
MDENYSKPLAKDQIMDKTIRIGTRDSELALQAKAYGRKS